MTKKRSKEEMCEQILREAAKPDGVSPAEVTVRLRISWSSYQELVTLMLKEHLLRKPINNLYTEPRGFHYIEAREKLREILALG